MNKKLVALAVASVCALPLAAQAQTANVQLGGRIHTTFENIRPDQANLVSTNRVSGNSSRFWLRGTEKLTGDLSAIFHIETGFNSDGSDNNAAGAAATAGGVATRDTWVGLQGGFGRVRMGQMDTPYKDVDGPTSLFFDTGIQARTGLLSNCGVGFGNDVCFQRRQPNSVRYDTPSFSGWTVGVQYGINREAPANSTQKAFLWSLSVNGTFGPVRAAIAYERHEDFQAPARHDSQGLKFTASGAIGPLTIGGVYERLRYQVPNQTITGQPSLLIGGDVKRDYWSFTGKFKLGSGNIVGQYSDAGDGKGSFAARNATTNALVVLPIGSIANGSSTGARQYTLGYEHNLSNRTQIYGYWTRIRNDSNAAYRYAFNGFNVANGTKPSGFALGVVHNF